VACILAIIYFAVYEIGKLVPQHGKYLPLMLQVIDDIIGVWVGDSTEMEWKDFKNDANDFSIPTRM
jgi:hypothetical protein